jgi:hypothetical protein
MLALRAQWLYVFLNTDIGPSRVATLNSLASQEATNW